MVMLVVLSLLAAGNGPRRPPVSLSISAPRTIVPSGAPGTGGFIGRAPLPEDPSHSSLVPDPAMSVVTYFREVVNDPDLELQVQSISDELEDDRRYAFIQSCHGVPIVGTYALAQVQDGMLHYSRHYLIKTPDMDTYPGVTAADAQRVAIKFGCTLGRDAMAGQGPPSLAILYLDGHPVLVWNVPVETKLPHATWSVFVDAEHAMVMDHQETGMRMATVGNVTALVEPSCQGEKTVSVSLPAIEWTRGLVTGPDGSFRAVAPVEMATVQISGPYFAVTPASGDAWSMTTKLHGSPAFNEVNLTTAPLSQVDAFYHASRARAWLRGRLDEMTDFPADKIIRWTNTQMPIRVDLPSGYQGFSCNAYYDGVGLNFYEADARHGCLNTGRVAKIVFHEYGHGVHDHLTWSRATFDGQVSEAAGDYISATITGDPVMTGLSGCDVVLPGRTTKRTCVNNFTYCRKRRCHSHPRDEIHNAAPVLCGAFWQLRQEIGADAADRLFINFLTLASDMESVYTAAIAADDDEDGDPTNGTTNSCAINRAFLGGGAQAHFPDQVRDVVPCAGVP